MVNKLLCNFLLSLLILTNAAFAVELAILDQLSSHKVIKHSIGLFKDVWQYEIARIDSKSINTANVIISTLLMIIGIKLAKRLSITIRKRMLGLFRLDSNASSAIERFIYYILVVLITLTALDVSNIPLSGLTFIGGALAIGIGFGSQNVLNNFISGIIIMIENPIRVGDVIEIDSKIAVVINVGARCVHLKTYDNIDLLIPNSTIIQSSITNWTLEDNVIRVTSTYFIDGDCSPQLTSELLKQALNEDKHIVKSYPILVCLDKFDPYGIKFDIYFFINIRNLVDRKQIINNLNMTVHKLLTTNDIRFSYYSGYAR